MRELIIPHAPLRRGFFDIRRDVMDPIAQALAEIRAGSQTTAPLSQALMLPEPSVTPSAPVRGHRRATDG